ncbi:MAG: FprA family A-type flavoprotein [Veillonella sp.]|uniref:FprA family A-type flavoprotein n=1 Tax=Veillonella sp. TaxID=1926307 RepID=UPI0025D24335|nr:FprA family A-type flavoprotein [Veillonella sp.]MBS4914165.1 FprA family A-type flavoprotein [Veillonella sp.]
MHCAQKMTDNIYWIGSNDWDTERFENLFPIPLGVSYNSYFIDDEKTCIVDSVDDSIRQEFFDNVEYLLNGRQLDYVIVNHMEPDHCSTLVELVDRYPNVKMVGNRTTFRLFEQFYGRPCPDNYYEVKEGDTISLGKHTLHSYTMPMVHWPEVTCTFESTTGILFSADAFGTFGTINGNIFADQLDFERVYEDEARRYYTNIVGKYGVQVQNAIKKALPLGIKMLAPLHGPIWRTPESIKYLIEKYMHWSTYSAEKKGVVIAFGSMYGNTAEMAQQLAKLLSLRGITDIKIYDVSKTNPSYIIADAWKYSHLVCMAPTYNLALYLTMENLLYELKALNFHNHKVSIVGNHSWASAAMKRMVEYFKNEFKDMEIVGTPLDIRGALHPQQLPLFEKLADDIVASIEATEIKHFSL